MKKLFSFFFVFVLGCLLFSFAWYQHGRQKVKNQSSLSRKSVRPSQQYSKKVNKKPAIPPCTTVSTSEKQGVGLLRLVVSETH